MPRPATAEGREAARKRVEEKLPLQARTEIAQLRNLRARQLEAQQVSANYSAEFKAGVRRLSKKYDLSINAMSLMLDISWDWIRQIMRDGRQR